MDCDDVLRPFSGLQPLEGRFFVQGEWAGHMQCSILSREHVDHDLKTRNYHETGEELFGMAEDRQKAYATTCFVLLEVLDENGCIRMAVLDDETEVEGTGSWANEVNSCNILVFERILTDPKHLRRGIGRAAVKAAIDAAKAITNGQPLIVFAIPSLLGEFRCLTETDERFMNAPQEDKFQLLCEAGKWPWKFWRAMGFRRVMGREELAAYATDPTYPCHYPPEESSDDEGEDVRDKTRHKDQNDTENPKLEGRIK
ncbi:hypothetical protein F5Y18DRAFT_386656 [Xylariaceae sp. FL1019]|nr:hypothetical protein F5Y18DRAFT_386656 [Xylariaceae sp. FL1019]